MVPLLQQDARCAGASSPGSSIYNVRIERLWVDLWRDVTSLSYYLFMWMADQGLLDITSDIHIWVLHFVFQPRIQTPLNVNRDEILTDYTVT